MPSPGSFLEVPCAKCGRRGSDIRWGELCPLCTESRNRRASLIGRRVALPATAAVGLWLWLTLPPRAEYARIYGMVAVVATYLLVRRIVSRIAQDLLK